MPGIGRLAKWALLATSAWIGVALAVEPSVALPVLLNPFDDPFMPAMQGRPCPLPQGPAYSEDERRAESHSRAERGTSCWLAGTCVEPNAYRYDRGIADAVVAALRADKALAGASIWVIVQRRIVMLQGCAADLAQAARAESDAQSVPDVQVVLPMLALPGQVPRYPLAASGPAR